MTDQLSPQLRGALRQLKLTPVLDTLLERLTLARQDLLEPVLADETSRRDRLAAERRARVTHLDPTMVLEAWDDTTPGRFDRQLWNELCSLRFLQDASCELILGPVGVGKTMLANCLSHIAARRQHSVLMFRTERLLKRLKAARPEGTYGQEPRRLTRTALLTLDDPGLHPLDMDATQDVYEVVVERHRRASTVMVSNREPQEWLPTISSTRPTSWSWKASPTGAARSLDGWLDELQHPRRYGSVMALPVERRCPVCGERPDSPRPTYCSGRYRQRAHRRRWCRSLGAGGPCVHGDQPVAVSDLLDP
ncbi:MAG TPA: ATP-binding protein [Candidatus Dormibacteraeota bacterium]|nr:ATP-binding protein [Candidatus Dormibacteraeota bacterium]